MFIDKVKIFVEAGRGGDGCLSFRREKFIPFGGPNGGNGGSGGNVYLVADKDMTTLLDFSFRPHFTAERGNHGEGSDKYGRSAEDLYIRVPRGTVISRLDESGKEFIADLVNDGDKSLVAKGGRGGRGNASFKTHRITAPRISEKGEPGEKLTIELELKLIADVGFIGCPNAGKSTLLSRITSARPKIADYPFTTLSPNLGVCNHKGKSFVVADIPGLIENASQGKGLGIGFLRHIERTRMLVHLVDAYGYEGKPCWKSLVLINKELARYSKKLVNKPMLVVLNKLDLVSDKKERTKLVKKLSEEIKKKKNKSINNNVFSLSAATGEGINGLLDEIITQLRVLPADIIKETDGDVAESVKKYIFQPDFFVEKQSGGHVFVVSGKKVEKFISMTNFAQEESVRRLINIFKKMGVDKALIKQGIKNKDLVKIGSWEFEYQADIL